MNRLYSRNIDVFFGVMTFWYRSKY